MGLLIFVAQIIAAIYGSPAIHFTSGKPYVFVTVGAIKHRLMQGKPLKVQQYLSKINLIEQMAFFMAVELAVPF